MPYYTVFLARACEIAGQMEESLALLDDALQLSERTGERWFAAELNRHKGRLLLRQGHAEAAEELYRKALAIAREQEAKLWELRAAVSLARLRRYQGRRAEARNLLRPVYGGFSLRALTRQTSKKQKRCSTSSPDPAIARLLRRLRLLERKRGGCSRQTMLSASLAKARVHLSAAGATEIWVPSFTTELIRGLKAHGTAARVRFHPGQIGRWPVGNSQ
jgi:tetratricopeptide (TPR) repeat protein